MRESLNAKEEGDGISTTFSYTNRKDRREASLYGLSFPIYLCYILSRFGLPFWPGARVGRSRQPQPMESLIISGGRNATRT
jgi:hypothetical protein